MSLGMALAGQKRYVEAMTEYQSGLQLQPDNANIRKFLSATAPLADAELMLANLTDQLKTNATPEVILQFAVAQTVLGNYSEAVASYQKSLAQVPDSPAALNNLAWLLATCPDPTVRNGLQAVPLAEHACELTHFKNTFFIGTLAAAYAEAGRFNEAVATAQKACANATAQGEIDLFQRNQTLLESYQNHQPYHDSPIPPIPGRD